MAQVVQNYYLAPPSSTAGGSSGDNHNHHHHRHDHYNDLEGQRYSHPPPTAPPEMAPETREKKKKAQETTDTSSVQQQQQRNKKKRRNIIRAILSLLGMVVGATVVVVVVVVINGDTPSPPPIDEEPQQEEEKPAAPAPIIEICDLDDTGTSLRVVPLPRVITDGVFTNTLNCRASVANHEDYYNRLALCNPGLSSFTCYCQELHAISQLEVTCISDCYTCSHEHQACVAEEHTYNYMSTGDKPLVSFERKTHYESTCEIHEIEYQQLANDGPCGLSLDGQDCACSYQSYAPGSSRGGLDSGENSCTAEQDVCIQANCEAAAGGGIFDFCNSRAESSERFNFDGLSSDEKNTFAMEFGFTYWGENALLENDYFKVCPGEDFPFRSEVVVANQEGSPSSSNNNNGAGSSSSSGEGGEQGGEDDNNNNNNNDEEEEDEICKLNNVSARFIPPAKTVTGSYMGTSLCAAERASHEDYYELIGMCTPGLSDFTCYCQEIHSIGQFEVTCISDCWTCSYDTEACFAEEHKYRYQLFGNDRPWVSFQRQTHYESKCETHEILYQQYADNGPCGLSLDDQACHCNYQAYTPISSSSSGTSATSTTSDACFENQNTCLQMSCAAVAAVGGAAGSSNFDFCAGEFDYGSLSSDVVNAFSMEFDISYWGDKAPLEHNNYFTVCPGEEFPFR